MARPLPTFFSRLRAEMAKVQKRQAQARKDRKAALREAFRQSVAS